jgi:hypothetical protein
MESIVVFGVLESDGTVRLEHPLDIPSGPMQVTLRPISRHHERLPDLPIQDECILPPCELPRSGFTQLVRPIYVPQRLPDPLFDDEMANDIQQAGS